MTTGGRRGAGWAGPVALAVVLSTGAASAAPAPAVRLAWSTYLRSGPGETFQAVDEIEHGVALVVRGCANGWCRVSADGIAGYVDQAALVLPAPPAPQPSAGACVVVGQADDRRPMPTRFCSPAPPTR